MATPGRRQQRRRESDVLEEPKGLSRGRRRTSRDVFGRFSESFARAMGTSRFLIGMTVFVAVWIAYNSVFAIGKGGFDPVDQLFPGLTLILSLQASYAAPLILLAQNRQDDRDRVQVEQDRQRAERNLDDTEYLAREIVALRLLVRDMASKDFLRAELRDLLDELDERAERRRSGGAAEPRTLALDADEDDDDEPRTGLGRAAIS